MKRQHQHLWFATVLWLALGISHAWAAQATEAPEHDSKSVKVTIDYGDGVEKRFTAIPWQDPMTVWDAMRLAAKHPRGIKFEHRGKGATALLTQIDDLKNEGGGKRNWVYRVNEKLADRSLGILEIKAGDTILWRFEKYR